MRLARRDDVRGIATAFVLLRSVGTPLRRTRLSVPVASVRRFGERRWRTIRLSLTKPQSSLRSICPVPPVSNPYQKHALVCVECFAPAKPKTSKKCCGTKKPPRYCSSNTNAKSIFRRSRRSLKRRCKLKTTSALTLGGSVTARFGDLRRLRLDPFESGAMPRASPFCYFLCTEASDEHTHVQPVPVFHFTLFDLGHV